jgi:two-component system CAI-1 autoinducer sensor kinase/phosphatase CqsS
MKANTNATLLVVDDNVHFLVTLKDFLSFEGFNVETAPSGEHALELLKSLSPDLIILDISMPGIGGIEFLKRISDEAGVPQYPVLVLTARGTLRSFFAKLPIDAFISKPCPEAELLTEIRGILSRRKRRAKAAGPMPSRLMLVEDNPEAATKLAAFFLSAGFRVDVLSSATELMNAARENQPDVILIKDSLPQMKGHVVAPLMAAMSSTRTIPVVLYDDVPEDDTYAAALPQGVSRFLSVNDGPALLKAVTETLGV